MSFLPKTIFTGFHPNLQKKDVLLALSFFLPWKWSRLEKGEANQKVESWLKNYYKVSSAACFDSGRSSLYLALKALNIQAGDEVLVQAYTCAVVSNAIIWTGAKPIYVDIKNDFTMDPEDVKKKITPRSKVLLIQHTFGISADITSLLKIAKENNFATIEDCAHVMGGTSHGRLLGTFADIGMLSFGSEKPVSCGRGGALITSSQAIGQKIYALQNELAYTSVAITLKQLYTFFLFFICKPFYSLGIGKWKLAFAKQFNLVSRIIEPKEKRGENLPFYPARLSNPLAEILLGQLASLEQFNILRAEYGKEYTEALRNTNCLPNFTISPNTFFLRFPLVVKNPMALHTLAKKRGILLGDWYNTPIAPKDADAEAMQYVSGSCPVAERLAKNSINLPTHYQLTQSDIKKIIEMVQLYANQNN